MHCLTISALTCFRSGLASRRGLQRSRGVSDTPITCAGAYIQVSHFSAHANVLLIVGAFVSARENRFLLQEREIMGQQLECALLSCMILMS